MNNQDHTYYFIRYPVGAGGVHLSNLISLDASFAPKIHTMDRDNYINYLLDFYNSHNTMAHIDSHHIINDIKWIDYIKNLDYSFLSSISLGHAASFDWAEDTLKTLKIKKYISLTMNKEESVDIVRTREKKLFNTDTLLNKYYRTEIQHFYNRWFVSLDPSIVDDDINLSFEVKDFYNNIELIIGTINKKFNLNIPIELACSLHQKWLVTAG